jgi:hypothetical protein
MRRHALVVGLALLGLAALAAFAGWAFFAVSQVGGGWRGLAPIWPFVLGAVVVVAILSGGLMWLAFYSANHGFDDHDER